ncbi:MAG TPA: hypothetical protein VHA12_02230 [Candidatus Nanoarchaeia archaeon]|nr:hypothetical protein [Candidatus Nanoarchaeia archaeon]
MNEKEIYDKIESLRQPLKISKFLGAMSNEVIRDALIKEGFRVSERDSFIKGVPYEIDLMILKKKAVPIFNGYYDPEDVLCVFELKYRGIYGKEELSHIKKMFESVKMINKSINGIYLTVYENKKHSHRATKEKIGMDIFELFSPNTSMDSAMKKGIFYDSATGDWKRLINHLSTLS